MIKLEIFNFYRKETHYYKSKTKALGDIKSNGLKSYEYSLTDTKENTVYKNGLWLNKKEYELLENGASIKYIRILRRRNKKL